MKKMIFICCSFFIFIMGVSAYDAVAVMDADSKRVLYGQNIDEKALIASTTKIMTALVVINNSDLDTIIKVGDEVLDAYGSAIYIKPEEKMSIRDLLYGLMLRSGNDAALTLAKNVAGSVDGFVKLMNDTALSIGMHDTVFQNPHGLDEKTQNKSTVYDMCLLMVEAMNNEDFREITKTKKYISKSNFNTYTWFNKNRLLSDYEYATGGKIGFTTKARHTFVSSATKDDKNLVIATFKDSDRFDTHKSLYEKYFEMYKKYTVIDKDNFMVDYEPGYRVFVPSSFSMLLTKDETKRVKREVEFFDSLGSFEKARVVGTVSISLDGKVYKKINIYAEKQKTHKRTLLEKIKDLISW